MKYTVVQCSRSLGRENVMTWQEGGTWYMGHGDMVGAKRTWGGQDMGDMVGDDMVAFTGL